MATKINDLHNREGKWKQLIDFKITDRQKQILTETGMSFKNRIADFR